MKKLSLVYWAVMLVSVLLSACQPQVVEDGGRDPDCRSG
jgi:predicted small secreted protein